MIILRTLDSEKFRETSSFVLAGFGRIFDFDYDMRWWSVGPDYVTFVDLRDDDFS